MPVKGVTNNNLSPTNRIDNWFAKSFGYNFNNWSYKNLMRLQFIMLVLSIFGWIFLIFTIAFFVSSQNIYNSYNALSPYNQHQSNGVDLYNSYNAQHVFAIFSVIVFFILWAVLIIMAWYSIDKAKNIDVLNNSWWWSILCLFLPLIFIFVSFFFWRSIFKNSSDLKKETQKEVDKYELEQEAINKVDIINQRQKVQEEVEKEEENKEKLKISTKKPIINKNSINKKKKRH